MMRTKRDSRVTHMHHDAFNGINNQRNAVDHTKRSRDFVTETNMAGCVNHVDQVTLVRSALQRTTHGRVT
jgi:hypothetical protein